MWADVQLYRGERERDDQPWWDLHADGFGVVSVEVKQELNRVPFAKLMLKDLSSQSEAQTLRVFPPQPGEVLTLKLTPVRAQGGQGDPGASAGQQARSPAESAVDFVGLVVRRSVTTGSAKAETTLELRGLAFRMTRQRTTDRHDTSTDEGILTKLVERAGLTCQVSATEVVGQPRSESRPLVQQWCSDWDFVVSLAEARGMVVDADQRLVRVRHLQERGDSHLLDYGRDAIRELEIEDDAAELVGEVQLIAPNVGGEEEGGLGATGEPPGAPQTASAEIPLVNTAARLGARVQTVEHGAPLTELEAEALRQGLQARSELAVSRGRVVVEGRAWAPMDTLTLLGAAPLTDLAAEEGAVGPQPPAGGSAASSREFLISAVTHQVGSTGWDTELTLGMSTERMTSRSNVAGPEAGGVVPPIFNLRTATVVEYGASEGSRLLAKVNFEPPGMPAVPLPARVAQPEAGKEAGVAFWPRAGDEVVCGFLGGDPGSPVVLGSLYSAKRPPPPSAAAPDGHVNALLTRKGLEVVLDDAGERIALSTPGGRRVELDDKQERLRLQDAHGNEVVLDEAGISLRGPNVRIEATGTSSGGGSVEIKGESVDVQ